MASKKLTLREHCRRAISKAFPWADKRESGLLSVQRAWLLGYRFHQRKAKKEKGK